MKGLDISGIDKAILLAALYNNARPLGLGLLQAKFSVMTRDEALAVINRRTIGKGKVHFDHVHGRPIKVWFHGDELIGAGVYDRDHGPGACERIVGEVRAAQGPL